MMLLELLEKKGDSLDSITVNAAKWFGPRSGGHWERARATWVRGKGWLPPERLTRLWNGTAAEQRIHIPFYWKVGVYWVHKRSMDVNVCHNKFEKEWQ